MKTLYDGCEFYCVEFPGADFSNGIFRKCDFTWADLREAKFCQSSFENVTFKGADLRGADFTGATYKDLVVFEGALIDGVVGLPQEFIETVGRPLRVAPSLAGKILRSVLEKASYVVCFTLMVGAGLAYACGCYMFELLFVRSEPSSQSRE